MYFFFLFFFFQAEDGIRDHCVTGVQTCALPISTEPCGYCRVAKALLAKRNVPYEEINLAKDPEGRAELVRLTGMMTFPQVVIDGEPIGGYQELVAADRDGRLRDFSEAAA